MQTHDEGENWDQEDGTTSPRHADIKRRMRVEIDKLYGLLDADVEEIADELAQIHLEL